MPRFCAHPSALSHPRPSAARSLAQATAIVVTSLAVAAGCASSSPRSSSTIQPEPTGNVEMDRILAMLKQLDEREDDAIDLASLAAQSLQRSPTQATEPADSQLVASSQIEDSASDPGEGIGLESIGQPSVDGPGTGMADEGTSHSSLYAHPFADRTLLDEPDSFEAQLSPFNATPGLLSPDADNASDPNHVEQSDEPSQFALARRLADEIRDKTIQGEPFADALVLAAISPLVGLAPELDPSLTSEAVEITEAVYKLFTDLSSLGSDPDPDEAAAIARAFSDSLGQSRPLEITTAVLCTRVDGFGRYRQVSDTPPKFLSGRTSRTVVYVEIDHFSHAPVSSNYRGPDQGQAQQWQVRLSQEINLYRAHETVPVWTLRESNLSDISRNKRRDFHVTNEITLPATLALGMYNLKITMRDLVSGSVAEEMIAIQIVNDASLLSSN